jgi:hypothetical protein
MAICLLRLVGRGLKPLAEGKTIVIFVLLAKQNARIVESCIRNLRELWKSRIDISLAVATTAPSARNTNRIAQKAAWVSHVLITVVLALSGFATLSARPPTAPNARSTPAKSWKNSMRTWRRVDMAIGRWSQEMY